MKRQVYKFDVPGYGSVYLRELTVGERKQFLQQSQDPDKALDLLEGVVCQTVCDAEGNLLHASSDDLPTSYADALANLVIDKLLTPRIEKKDPTT